MNSVEKIRQEIERRKKEFMYDSLAATIGRYYEDRDLLAFIDSLPEEKCKENTDSFTSLKDELALTWEDMATIDSLLTEVSNSYAVGNFDYDGERENFYNEVLTRFKETKK